MVYVGATTKHVFAVHAGDVFWCTADCGWVTGHSYVTYGESVGALPPCICIPVSWAGGQPAQARLLGPGHAPIRAAALRPRCPALRAGPLLQRATSLVFEGVPTYPTPARCWEVCDK